MARDLDPRDALARLLDGDLDVLCAGSDGQFRLDAPRPTILLPGSFNPLHRGHLGMAAVAARRGDQPTAFELSVINVEKPPLSDAEVTARLSQFLGLGLGAVWLTRAPTFVAKARLFGAVTFVVGADTAARVVQPRFYGDDPCAMRQALEELRAHGCRFLVTGRSDGVRFIGLGQLAIPDEFADLFEGVPEEEFRADVSSSALRGTPPRP